MYEGFSFEGADETFLKVARKIEDAVMFAINSGVKVAAWERGCKDDKCRCPLGCLWLWSECDKRYPLSRDVAVRLGMDDDDPAFRFYNAFDNGAHCAHGDPYERLDLAYRRRFVEGGK
jgi:hypothetical protein